LAPCFWKPFFAYKKKAVVWMHVKNIYVSY
jgi:hypothetical protein